MPLWRPVNNTIGLLVLEAHGPDVGLLGLIGLRPVFDPRFAASPLPLPSPRSPGGFTFLTPAWLSLGSSRFRAPILFPAFFSPF